VRDCRLRCQQIETSTSTVARHESLGFARSLAASTIACAILGGRDQANLRPFWFTSRPLLGARTLGAAVAQSLVLRLWSFALARTKIAEVVGTSAERL
jgi:hypothetical protein